MTGRRQDVHVDVVSLMEQVLDTADRLRDEIRGEIDEARRERDLLCALEIDGLLKRATARQRFNTAAATLHERLLHGLEGVGDALDLETLTLDAVAARMPDEAETLAARLRAIGSMAEVLHDLDLLNRKLGQRAMAVIAGYLGAMAPVGPAYDRRGVVAGSPAFGPAATSHRA